MQLRDKLGVVVHQAPPEVLTPLINVGFRCFRVTGQWFLIETSPGYYDWSWLDRAMEQIDSIGGQVMLSMEGTPVWLDPSYTKAFGGSIPIMKQEWIPSWQNFVDAISDRYKGDDVTFATDTEINMVKQWQNPLTGGLETAQAYIDLVIKPASEVLKPKGCKLVGTGVTMQGEREDTWNRAMNDVERLMLNAGDYLDNLDVHIYRGTGAQTVGDYQRFIAEYKSMSELYQLWDRRKLYLSETGFDETFTQTPTGQSATGFWGKILSFLTRLVDYWVYKKTYTGEQAQADKFPPLLNFFLSDSMFEKIYIYHSNGSSSGLLRDSENFRLKQAAKIISDRLYQEI